MAGVNQVFSLADDIARYAKICGKKSILETKPIQGRIDIEGLRLAPEAIGDTFTLTSKSAFASRIKELSTPGKESETLKKLFSAEFRPQRHFDENGYMVTTVIDKATQKPVEVFVKKDFGNGYNFYKKVSGEYKKIGTVDIHIDKEERFIHISYMEAFCQKEYTGIGIRGHQIAVETAIKEDFDSINLESMPDALPFHEKCLFQPLEKRKTNIYEFDDYKNDLAWAYSIPEEQIDKLIKHKRSGRIVTIDLKRSIANINKFLKGIGSKDSVAHPTDGFLVLDGKYLALWKEMARSQPITL